MALGPDQIACRTELVEAMRARLDGLTPPQGANVDHPEVLANFDALGTAVFRIATVLAEVRASAAEDAAFFAWLAQANALLSSLRAWQAAVAAAFAAWAPTTAPEVALRTAITAAPAVGPAPAAAPASLAGRIR